MFWLRSSRLFKEQGQQLLVKFVLKLWDVNGSGLAGRWLCATDRSRLFGRRCFLSVVGLDGHCLLVDERLRVQGAELIEQGREFLGFMFACDVRQHQGEGGNRLADRLKRFKAVALCALVAAH
jgi:hypothetical protein